MSLLPRNSELEHIDRRNFCKNYERRFEYLKYDIVGFRPGTMKEWQTRTWESKPDLTELNDILKCKATFSLKNGVSLVSLANSTIFFADLFFFLTAIFMLNKMMAFVFKCVYTFTRRLTFYILSNIFVFVSLTTFQGRTNQLRKYPINFLHSMVRRFHSIKNTLFFCRVFIKE